MRPLTGTGRKSAPHPSQRRVSTASGGAAALCPSADRLSTSATISGPVRSVQRSWWNCIGKPLDGSGDPAPGIGTVVIAGGRELVNARAAFLKRLVAVALHH